MKNPMKHYHKEHPKYSNRTYQQVYFNTRNLPDEERERLATEAYERELEKKRPK